MEIKKAQIEVEKFLEKTGYTEIETEPIQAFTHLIEEVGEVARAILWRDTPRGELSHPTEPENLEDEVADIFWQTLKLAIYLDLDLESAFLAKFEKNRNKPKIKKD